MILKKNKIDNKLLIEIGIEDIPYKYIEKISNLMLNNIIEYFKKDNLLFNKSNLFFSNRRIIIFLYGVKIKSSNYYKIIKGPSINNLFDYNNYNNIFEKWINKYKLNKKKIKYLINDNGIWIIYYLLIKYNNNYKELNKKIFCSIKKSLFDISCIFKTNISNTSNKITFVKPIKNILIIFNNKLIKGSILNIKSDLFSYSNINSCLKKIYISNFKNYINILRIKGKVIIKNKTREDNIKYNIDKILNNYKIYIKNKNDFIKKNSLLNEWPSVVKIEFNIVYLNIPEYIIISVFNSINYLSTFYLLSNKLSNIVIFISNNYSKNNKLLIYWSSIFLNNYLNRIYYLYKLDNTLKLDNFKNKTKNIVFRKKLGTIYEKIIRIEKFILFIVNNNNLISNIKNIILLYKYDYYSNLYNEISKIYGLIGIIYYLKYEKKNNFFINYKFFNESNYYYLSKLTCIIILLDKLDNFIGNFFIYNLEKINISSSSDPFFIKKDIIYIISFLIRYNINLDINELIKKNFLLYNKYLYKYNYIYIKKYFINRLINYYINIGYKLEVVNSVLYYNYDNTLFNFNLIINSLNKFINNNYKLFNNIINIYIRFKKILDIKLNKFNLIKYIFNKKEILLFMNINYKINNIYLNINNCIKKNEYYNYFLLLNDICYELNIFLNNIFVLIDNNILRKHRILFLKKINLIFSILVNFNFLKNLYKYEIK